MTLSFSQTSYPKIHTDSTVIILNSQLKFINKSLIEAQEYKDLYNKSEEEIGIYKKEIETYKSINSDQQININNLTKNLEKSNNSNKALSRLNKFLTGTTIGFVITSVLLLFK